MTNERKKAIATLGATLIVGILIGVLLPGFLGRLREGGRHPMDERGRGRGDDDKKAWFAHTIYKIIKPDSAQARKIKPITEWASQQVEQVENKSNQELIKIMDSVKVQLKPIITEEQLKRLDGFSEKAKGHWRKH
ncbi:MAG: hypothetical protein ABI663_12860 [Chryseolinea sp.]